MPSLNPKIVRLLAAFSYLELCTALVPFPTVSSREPIITLHPCHENSCATEATRLQLSDPPYENYFYADCHSSSHVIVTSPLESSDLSFIGPRLLIAWASGNSGVVAYFEPQNGVNGSLAIELLHSAASGNLLDGIFEDSENNEKPVVGVQGYLSLNSSALLTVPILGSIRTIRDFSEGPSLLYPVIQDANEIGNLGGSGAYISRQWLDNITTTTLSFLPTDDGAVTTSNDVLQFEAGTYQFNATFNYPQLEQLRPSAVLNNASQELLDRDPDSTISLSFLSYTDKLLAGTWRFLTYFGRDTMISMLLLQPVLSEGENSAVEAVIGAVLERINSSDGSVAHEETLGDYATFLALQNNITSTDPQYDYKMIDTDFFLPVAMEYYFLRSSVGQSRSTDFLAKIATVDPTNEGLSYKTLTLIAAERIMALAMPFTRDGGQTRKNLIHLKEGQIVGQWRDSGDGIGGGRIPYDVNTALVPAALRSIAALASEGFFPEHPDWGNLASQSAGIWEDSTLEMFEISIEPSEAQSLVDAYVSDNSFPFPAQSDIITDTVQFYAVALEGSNDQDHVRVLHTDDCFRLFLLNSTNQAQLNSFLNQVSTNILAPYPVGLSTEAGLIVANPAYGGDPVYSERFTNSAYHGTVIWSWQLAMMAAGLERQLDRCGTSSESPEFCSDAALFTKIKRAYNHLWDLIEANRDQLSGEVWSWTYTNGIFEPTALGGQSSTESNIRQLWSLTFLAITRNIEF